MLLPSSGMSATMNAVNIKNWGWRSILTGIDGRKRIKEICGIDSFRPRQRSPFSPEISKRYAEASNRKERGMYITDGVRYNADAVGAFNILRKYLSVSGKQKELSVTGLKNPEIIKVAV